MHVSMSLVKEDFLLLSPHKVHSIHSTGLFLLFGNWIECSWEKSSVITENFLKLFKIPGILIILFMLHFHTEAHHKIIIQFYETSANEINALHWTCTIKLVSQQELTVGKTCGKFSFEYSRQRLQPSEKRGFVLHFSESEYITEALQALHSPTLMRSMFLRN